MHLEPLDPLPMFVRLQFEGEPMQMLAGAIFFEPQMDLIVASVTEQARQKNKRGQIWWEEWTKGECVSRPCFVINP